MKKKSDKEILFERIAYIDPSFKLKLNENNMIAKTKNIVDKGIDLVSKSIGLAKEKWKSPEGLKKRREVAAELKHLYDVIKGIVNETTDNEEKVNKIKNLLNKAILTSGSGSLLNIGTSIAQNYLSADLIDIIFNPNINLMNNFTYVALVLIQIRITYQLLIWGVKSAKSIARLVKYLVEVEKEVVKELNNKNKQPENTNDNSNENITEEQENNRIISIYNKLINNSINDLI
jgi:hypothetical protein